MHNNFMISESIGSSAITWASLIIINSLYSKIFWIKRCFQVYFGRKQLSHRFNGIFSSLQELCCDRFSTRISHISISQAFADSISKLSSSDETNHFIISPYCFKTQKSFVTKKIKIKKYGMVKQILFSIFFSVTQITFNAVDPISIHNI